MMVAERKAADAEGGFKMEIKAIEKSKDNLYASVHVKGSPCSYINLYRRVCLDYVPTMAIETVEIKKNNSLLYDEMLALRLGLLVLKTDLKSYNELKDYPEDAEPGPGTHVTLKLKAKGPGTVYASELKSDDPKIKPVYPKTPIVKLLANQEVELVATAQLGYGKDHTKWTPGLIYYRHAPIIEKKDMKKVEDIVKENKEAALGLKGDKAHVKDTPLTYQLSDGGVQIIRDKGVNVKENDDEFIFTIESWGAIPVSEIISKSAEIIQEQLDDFTKAVKEL